MNIGHVAQASGVSQRMIRHYEKIGLIPAPPRRHGTFRNYSPEDLHRLTFVANARDLGFPIDEIRELLSLWVDRKRSSADVKALALARANDLHRKAERLEQMRATLLELANRCHGDQRPECPILAGIENTFT